MDEGEGKKGEEKAATSSAGPRPFPTDPRAQSSSSSSLLRKTDSSGGGGDGIEAAPAPNSGPANSTDITAPATMAGAKRPRKVGGAETGDERREKKKKTTTTTTAKTKAKKAKKGGGGKGDEFDDLFKSLF